VPGLSIDWFISRGPFLDGIMRRFKYVLFSVLMFIVLGPGCNKKNDDTAPQGATTFPGNPEKSPAKPPGGKVAPKMPPD
jgi:hypothetical protein